MSEQQPPVIINLNVETEDGVRKLNAFRSSISALRKALQALNNVALNTIIKRVTEIAEKLARLKNEYAGKPIIIEIQFDTSKIKARIKNLKQEILSKIKQEGPIVLPVTLQLTKSNISKEVAATARELDLKLGVGIDINKTGLKTQLQELSKANKFEITAKVKAQADPAFAATLAKSLKKSFTIPVKAFFNVVEFSQDVTTKLNKVKFFIPTELKLSKKELVSQLNETTKGITFRIPQAVIDANNIKVIGALKIDKIAALKIESDQVTTAGKAQPLPEATQNKLAASGKQPQFTAVVKLNDEEFSKLLNTARERVVQALETAQLGSQAADNIMNVVDKDGGKSPNQVGAAYEQQLRGALKLREEMGSTKSSVDELSKSLVAMLAIAPTDRKPMLESLIEDINKVRPLIETSTIKLDKRLEDSANLSLDAGKKLEEGTRQRLAAIRRLSAGVEKEIKKEQGLQALRVVTAASAASPNVSRAQASSAVNKPASAVSAIDTNKVGEAEGILSKKSNDNQKKLAKELAQLYADLIVAQKEYEAAGDKENSTFVTGQLSAVIKQIDDTKAALQSTDFNKYLGDELEKAGVKGKGALERLKSAVEEFSSASVDTESAGYFQELARQATSASNAISKLSQEELSLLPEEDIEKLGELKKEVENLRSTAAVKSGTEQREKIEESGTSTAERDLENVRALTKAIKEKQKEMDALTRHMSIYGKSEADIALYNAKLKESDSILKTLNSSLSKLESQNALSKNEGLKKGILEARVEAQKLTEELAGKKAFSDAEKSIKQIKGLISSTRDRSRGLVGRVGNLGTQVSNAQSSAGSMDEEGRLKTAAALERNVKSLNAEYKKVYQALERAKTIKDELARQGIKIDIDDKEIKELENTLDELRTQIDSQQKTVTQLRSREGQLGSGYSAGGTRKGNTASDINENLQLLEGAIQKGKELEGTLSSIKWNPLEAGNFAQTEKELEAQAKLIKELTDRLSQQMSSLGSKALAGGDKGAYALKELQNVDSRYSSIVGKASTLEQKLKSILKTTKDTNETTNLLDGSTSRIESSLARAVVNNSIFASSFAFIFGLVNQVKKSIDDFVNLQTQIARVVSVSESIPLTNKELGDVVGKTLVDASQRFGVSYEQSSQILREFGSAGVQAEVALRAFESTLRTVIATEAEAGEITRTVAAIYSVLGDSIDVAGGSLEKINFINDVMLRAFKDSQLELQELTQGFRFSSASARNVGVSFVELTALLGVLNNNMIRSGQAGRSLQTTFSQLARKAPIFARAFNVEVDTSKPLDFLDVLKQVNAQLRSGQLTTEEIERVFSIFGLEGARSFLVLSQQFDEVEDFIDSLNTTAQGSVLATSDIIFNTVGTRLQQLGRTIITSTTTFLQTLLGDDEAFANTQKMIASITRAIELLFGVLTNDNAVGKFLRIMMRFFVLTTIVKIIQTLIGTLTLLGTAMATANAKASSAWGLEFASRWKEVSTAYKANFAAIQANSAAKMKEKVVTDANTASNIANAQSKNIEAVAGSRNAAITNVEAAAKVKNNVVTWAGVKASLALAAAKVKAAFSMQIFVAALRSALLLVAPLLVLFTAVASLTPFLFGNKNARRENNSINRNISTIQQERQEYSENIRTYRTVERELDRIARAQNSSFRDLESVGAAARRVMDEYGDSISSLGRAQSMTNAQLGENINLLREQVIAARQADEELNNLARERVRTLILEGAGGPQQFTSRTTNEQIENDLGLPELLRTLARIELGDLEETPERIDLLLRTLRDKLTELSNVSDDFDADLRRAYEATGLAERFGTTVDELVDSLQAPLRRVDLPIEVQLAIEGRENLANEVEQLQRDLVDDINQRARQRGVQGTVITLTGLQDILAQEGNFEDNLTRFLRQVDGLSRRRREPRDIATEVTVGNQTYADLRRDTEALKGYTEAVARAREGRLNFSRQSDLQLAASINPEIEELVRRSSELDGYTRQFWESWRQGGSTQTSRNMELLERARDSIDPSIRSFDDLLMAARAAREEINRIGVEIQNSFSADLSGFSQIGAITAAMNLTRTALGTYINEARELSSINLGSLNANSFEMELAAIQGNLRGQNQYREQARQLLARGQRFGVLGETEFTPETRRASLSRRVAERYDPIFDTIGATVDLTAWSNFLSDVEELEVRQREMANRVNEGIREFFETGEGRLYRPDNILVETVTEQIQESEQLLERFRLGEWGSSLTVDDILPSVNPDSARTFLRNSGWTEQDFNDEIRRITDRLNVEVTPNVQFDLFLGDERQALQEEFYRTIMEGFEEAAALVQETLGEDAVGTLNLGDAFNITFDRLNEAYIGSSTDELNSYRNALVSVVRDVSGLTAASLDSIVTYTDEAGDIIETRIGDIQSTEVVRSVLTDMAEELKFDPAEFSKFINSFSTSFIEEGLGAGADIQTLLQATNIFETTVQQTMSVMVTGVRSAAEIVRELSKDLNTSFNRAAQIREERARNINQRERQRQQAEGGSGRDFEGMNRLLQFLVFSQLAGFGKDSQLGTAQNEARNQIDAMLMDQASRLQRLRELNRDIAIQTAEIFNFYLASFTQFNQAFDSLRGNIVDSVSRELGIIQQMNNAYDNLRYKVQELSSQNANSLDIAKEIVSALEEQLDLYRSLIDARKELLNLEQEELEGLATAALRNSEVATTVVSIRTAYRGLTTAFQELNVLQDRLAQLGAATREETEEEADLRNQVAAAINEYLKAYDSLLSLEQAVNDILDKRLEIMNQLSSINQSEIQRLTGLVTGALETALTRGASRFARNAQNIFGNTTFISENAVQRLVRVAARLPDAFESSNNFLSDMVKNLGEMQRRQMDIDRQQRRLAVARIQAQRGILDSQIQTGNVSGAMQSLTQIQGAISSLAQTAPEYAMSELRSLETYYARIQAGNQALISEANGLIEDLGNTRENLQQLYDLSLEYIEGRFAEAFDDQSVSVDRFAGSLRNLEDQLSSVTGSYTEAINSIMSSEGFTDGNFLPLRDLFENLGNTFGDSITSNLAIIGTRSAELIDEIGTRSESQIRRLVEQGEFFFGERIDPNAGSRRQIQRTNDAIFSQDSGFRPSQARITAGTEKSFFDDLSVAVGSKVGEEFGKAIKDALKGGIEVKSIGKGSIYEIAEQLGVSTERIASLNINRLAESAPRGRTSDQVAPDLMGLLSRLSSQEPRSAQGAEVLGSQISRVIGSLIEVQGRVTTNALVEAIESSLQEIPVSLVERNAEVVARSAASEVVARAQSIVASTLDERLEQTESIIEAQTAVDRLGPNRRGFGSTIPEDASDELSLDLSEFYAIEREANRRILQEELANLFSERPQDVLQSLVSEFDTAAKDFTRTLGNRLSGAFSKFFVENVQQRVRSAVQGALNIAGDITLGWKKMFEQVAASAKDSNDALDAAADDQVGSLQKQLRRNQISYFDYLNGLEDIQDQVKDVTEQEEGPDLAGSLLKSFGENFSAGARDAFSNLKQTAEEVFSTEIERSIISNLLFGSGTRSQRLGYYRQQMTQIAQIADSLGMSGFQAIELTSSPSVSSSIESTRRSVGGASPIERVESGAAQIKSMDALTRELSSSRDETSKERAERRLQARQEKADRRRDRSSPLAAVESQLESALAGVGFNVNFAQSRRDRNDVGSREVAKTLATAGSMFLAGAQLFVGNILSLSSRDLDSQVDAFIGAMEMLPEQIVGIIDTLVERIPDIVDAFATALPEIVESLFSRLDEIVNSLVDGLIQLLPVIVEQIPMIISGLVEGFAALLGRVGDIAAQALNSIIAEIPNIVETLIASAGDIVAGAIESAISLIEQAPKIAFNTIKSVAKSVFGVFKGIGGFFKRLFRRKKDAEEAERDSVTAIDAAMTSMPKFHTGGIVKSTDRAFDSANLGSDEVPAVLQVGEAVLTRQAVSALGGSGVVGALNGGTRIHRAAPKDTSIVDRKKSLLLPLATKLLGRDSKRESIVDSLFKFHTGGEITERTKEFIYGYGQDRFENKVGVDVASLDLNPLEMPVVLKQGEGILTQDGLQKLGGPSILQMLNNNYINDISKHPFFSTLMAMSSIREGSDIKIPKGVKIASLVSGVVNPLAPMGAMTMLVSSILKGARTGRAKQIESLSDDAVDALWSGRSIRDLNLDSKNIEGEGAFRKIAEEILRLENELRTETKKGKRRRLERELRNTKEQLGMSQGMSFGDNATRATVQAELMRKHRNLKSDIKPGMMPLVTRLDQEVGKLRAMPSTGMIPKFHTGGIVGASRASQINTDPFKGLMSNMSLIQRSMETSPAKIEMLNTPFERPKTSMDFQGTASTFNLSMQRPSNVTQTNDTYAFAPVINVQGGSSPEETSQAIQKALEIKFQEFYNTVRRNNSTEAGLFRD